MRGRDLVVTRWGARFRGRRLPCAIGRGGISDDKREGDGATPAGNHRIVGMLYRRDRLTAGAMARKAKARAIGPGDLWSDDSQDPCYNQMVSSPHRFGHERLRRSDPQYDLVLITDWNWPHAKPGRGSAIFIHIWRRPRWPTAGCIAFAPRDLLWIARHLQPHTKVILRR